MHFAELVGSCKGRRGSTLACRARQGARSSIFMARPLGCHPTLPILMTGLNRHACFFLGFVESSACKSLGLQILGVYCLAIQDSESLMYRGDRQRETGIQSPFPLIELDSNVRE